MNNKVIEDIIRDKKRCFFISPHLDDAILSSGALIRYLSKETSVVVATVFTHASSHGRPTISASAFLKQCGYENSERLFLDRRREDVSILKKIGANVVHFGFHDALWRRKTNLSFLEKFFGKIFPEFLVAYPTYRFHVSRGRISERDGDIVRRICKKIHSLLETSHEQYVIFCPQAIGGHVDHVAVRVACEKLRVPLILWSDFPYNVRKSIFNANAFRWEEGLQEKNEYISSYQSQVKALFPEGSVPMIPEEYVFL